MLAAGSQPMTRRTSRGSRGPGWRQTRDLKSPCPCTTLPQDERPATRIGSDLRGAWASALTLTPAVRRSWFRPTKTPAEILDGVADVAILACAGNRERASAISKSSWDAARLSFGRQDLPTAQTIRQRLHLSWTRTVQLALTDPSRRTTLLGQWDGSRVGPLGNDGPELAKRTMTAVALRLGHIPTSFEYDVGAKQLGMASRRRKNSRGAEAPRSSRSQAIPLRLPSSVYQVEVFESWPGAIEASGAGRLFPRSGKREIPLATDTLDEFIEKYGILPAQTYFVEWCRRMDIPIPAGRRWSDIVDEVWRRRCGRGAATPMTRTLSRNCPPLPATLPKLRRFRHGISFEEALASLRRYGALYLEPASLPRQKHYMAACRRDRQLIWPQTFGKFGKTFHEMCREAGI